MKVRGLKVRGLKVRGLSGCGRIRARCRFHQHAGSTNMPVPPTCPTPDSRLPTPDSRLPTPDSRFPTPHP
ncbi:hypothetical protein [Moorena sp. SIOASIH]|uniref:hypothetical protein n=1 Tax=Moorena sp. SIOASIH TaxID=2607817 RepID=UPI0025E20DD8|nr:hypothetical protein [Moorena sp. SIOASIH]